jgi:hypothetical protein
MPSTTIALCLAVLSAGPVAVDRAPLANGDFERRGAPGELPGYVATGTWSQEPVAAGTALRLGAGASVEWSLAFEAAPVADGVAPDGWYALVLVDVLAREPGARLELVVDGAPVPFVEVEGRLASRAGARAPARTRLFARLAGDGTTARVCRVQATGGAVLLDDLGAERHHRAPSRELRGKENGVDGPDQVACGALGFHALVEHRQRTFALMRVERDGPARAAGLTRGDLVVALEDRLLDSGSLQAGWEWFESGHEAALGRALESAALAGRSSIALTVLRADGPVRVTVAQPFTAQRFGNGIADELASTFPLGGPLSDALHRDLVGFAVRTQRDDGSWPGAPEVDTPLGALALLGTGDPAHHPAIERAFAAFARQFPRPSEMKGLAYWALAFHGFLASEWYLATGDAAALDWVREAIAWLPTTTHRSAFGMPAFGHGPEGLPYDDQALMAPAAHLLVFEALARRCGVESGVWEHIRPYVVHSWSDPSSGGHGAMGYNASYKDLDEFWSRSGLVALAEVLREDRETGMREPLCAVMEERHPWMFNSHAYGEPGAALGLLALAVAQPESFARVLPQWRWRFLCAWEPGHGLHYSSPHMGAPYMAEDVVVNLAYLLLFSVRERHLALSGRSVADDPVRRAAPTTEPAAEQTR